MTKPMNHRLRRKSEIALTKTRLAAAKGASAEATAAAEAIDDESFASVGSRRAAPLMKRQRGNAAPAPAPSKKDHSLGFSKLKFLYLT